MENWKWFLFFGGLGGLGVWGFKWNYEKLKTIQERK